MEYFNNISVPQESLGDREGLPVTISAEPQTTIYGPRTTSNTSP